MRCHEGGGLLTVHRSLTRFHFERVTRQLRLGDHDIDWYEVYFLNLRVHIDQHQKSFVSVLPVCERCLQMHCLECERCMELGIVDLYFAQNIAEDSLN